jgi:hypothetical protein
MLKVQVKVKLKPSTRVVNVSFKKNVKNTEGYYRRDDFKNKRTTCFSTLHTIIRLIRTQHIPACWAKYLAPLYACARTHVHNARQRRFPEGYWEGHFQVLQPTTVCLIVYETMDCRPEKSGGTTYRSL